MKKQTHPGTQLPSLRIVTRSTYKFLWNRFVRKLAKDISALQKRMSSDNRLDQTDHLALKEDLAVLNELFQKRKEEFEQMYKPLMPAEQNNNVYIGNVVLLEFKEGKKKEFRYAMIEGHNLLENENAKANGLSVISTNQKDADDFAIWKAIKGQEVGFRTFVSLSSGKGKRKVRKEVRVLAIYFPSTVRECFRGKLPAGRIELLVKEALALAS
jgi:hypothetical protein